MDYEKLIKDKNSGLISDEMILIIDNDSGFWTCKNNEYSQEQDAMKEEYTKRYGRPNGHEDIVEILQAIGINAEFC